MTDAKSSQKTRPTLSLVEKHDRLADLRGVGNLGTTTTGAERHKGGSDGECTRVMP